MAWEKGPDHSAHNLSKPPIYPLVPLSSLSVPRSHKVAQSRHSYFPHEFLDVDIDHKTAKSWLSVLEASGLVYLLPPYYSNITKRLVKTSKIYFLDTGLCSHLTRWPSPEALEAGAMSGAIFETYLMAEILKRYWHNGKPAYFYYYRDVDQKEIDLVLEEGNTLYPVEFKKTATPAKTASRPFRFWPG